MFERTLQDLIRGLRAHKTASKAQEDAFLAEVMVEIRQELRGKDMALKAEGVIKMCYLMMLYPIPAPPSFAFHVVEIMSSPRYHLKQLGYLAAPMAFTGDTEEVVLTVNGIKKDLLSPHISLPPLPLTALPHLLASSPSLSTTLHPDLLHLLTHSSPRIRKRAVLCLLPCWEAFPEGLREGFPRLREKLEDEDQGVVGAAVGVVMELARRQGGQNYLPLAPQLFGILTGSSNNWMLIKVVKLFAILTPLEPRLVRKLLPPITNLISSTSAISLLYECVRTCIVGGMLDPDRPESDALARVCVEKLGGYLRDEGGDQNLRYIALLAMVKIVPTHPHMVAEYQEEILASLDDPDVSIRMRALELVSSMVDNENLQSIADQFLSHLSPPEPSALPSAVASLQALSDPSASNKDTSAAVSLSPGYRRVLTQKLLGIVQHDTYANVTDFEWVVNLLVDVAYVSKVEEGVRIRDMMLDIVGRVRDVRAHAVKTLEKVVGDAELRSRLDAGDVKEAEMGLLLAAVWICGEYSSYLSSPLSTISNLTPSGVETAPPCLISLSVQAVAKIVGNHCAEISSFDRWSRESHTQAKDLIASCRNGIAPLVQHSDLEVQARAGELDGLLQFIAADLSSHKPPERLPRSIAAADKIPGVEGGFETDPAPPKNGTQEDEAPAYPKSLFLLQPLFTSHELNAVSAQAQDAVRLPEGLDLDRDLVPGGGWAGSEAELLESSADEADKEADILRQGGGAGMDELRRVIREGQKKDKRREGETFEERKARQAVRLNSLGVDMTRKRGDTDGQRRRERKERQKTDPYYLGGYADSEVDEIPIVVLDATELGEPAEAGPSDARAKKRTVKLSTGKKVKSSNGKKQNMQFDRLGEMPESGPASGAASPAPSIGSTRAGGGVQATGLAGVKLDGRDGETPKAVVPDHHRYDGADAVSPPNEDVEVNSGQQPGDQAVTGADIEVVQVKRKKKKKPVV